MTVLEEDDVRGRSARPAATIGAATCCYTTYQIPPSSPTRASEKVDTPHTTVATSVDADLRSETHEHRDGATNPSRHALHSVRRARASCPRRSDHSPCGHIHDMGGYDRRRAGGGAECADTRVSGQRLGVRDAAIRVCELQHAFVLRRSS